MNTELLQAIQASSGLKTTANGINYYCLPQDFDRALKEIPYFSIVHLDGDNITYFISEEVPEALQDMWVMHEEACSKSKCQQCAEITKNDIKEVGIQFNDEMYKGFLEMRLAMFSGLVHANPHGESRIYWYQSMAYLDTALKQLKKIQEAAQVNL